MRDFRAFFLRGVVWAVAALFSRALAAEPFDPTGSDYEGFSEFAELATRELGAGRIHFQKRLALDLLRPEDAIVLVDPSVELDVASYAAFMRDGGRVLLLDDFGTGDALLQHYGIVRVPLPLRPHANLRQNPSLPFAEPAGTHPVAEDVQFLALNHGTGVRHPDLSPIFRVTAADGTDTLFCQAGAVGKGRLLAMGDGSVLINAMMRYPGNRRFATNLLHYATDDDTWGRRQGNVFIVARGFEEAGVYGNRGVASTLRKAARAFQDARRTLAEEGLPPSALFLLALSLGMGLVVWSMARAGKRYRPKFPGFVRPLTPREQGGIVAHIAELSSGSSSRLLLLLELKAALEEGLSLALGFRRREAPDKLLGELARTERLPPPRLQKLSFLLARMAHVESLFVSRRVVLRITPGEVTATTEDVRSLLREAEGPSAPLPPGG